MQMARQTRPAILCAVGTGVRIKHFAHNLAQGHFNVRKARFISGLPSPNVSQRTLGMYAKVSSLYVGGQIKQTISPMGFPPHQRKNRDLRNEDLVFRRNSAVMAAGPFGKEIER